MPHRDPTLWPKNSELCKRMARYWVVNGDGPIGFRGPYHDKIQALTDRRPGEVIIATDALCNALDRLLSEKGAP